MDEKEKFPIEEGLGSLPGSGERIRSNSSGATRPRRVKQRSDFFTIREDVDEQKAISAEGPGSFTPTASAVHKANEVEMMGPILRRKKVVSLPLGDSSRAHQDFFGPPPTSLSAQGTFGLSPEKASSERVKQLSSESLKRRQKQRSGGAGVMSGIMRRKQVSMDLMAPERAAFFGGEEEVEVVLPPSPPPPASRPQLEMKEDVEAGLITEAEAAAPEELEEEPEVKLFRPLIFAPCHAAVGGSGGGHGGGGGHGHGGGAGRAPKPDAETLQLVQDQAARAAEMRRQLEVLKGEVSKNDDASPEIQATLKTMEEEQVKLDRDATSLASRMGIVATAETGVSPEHTQHSDDFAPDPESALQDGSPPPEETKALISSENLDFDGDIIRAGRKDYIMTGVLLCLMIALVGVVLGWHTQLDESHAIYGVVGSACATPCLGNDSNNNFWVPKDSNRFGLGEIIDLTTYVDPTETAGLYLEVEIVGVESGDVKYTTAFGPASTEHEREYFTTKVDTATFANPSEEHVINVYSVQGESHVEGDVHSPVSEGDSNATETTGTTLSFTMAAIVMAPFSKSSVIVAAVLMVVVYLFILLEVIHRTLIAIFGSMVALFFLFLMHDGHTESIAAVMLHMEWSTLALLFGMMMIVGELSHTGIFEWCAVRLLVSSKGSFKRLVVLLCSLTAVASAFLDNVTTMLLIAPVTIDMCRILDVDPRPYLISEVILSNIGGTATLIGDPPNIIIGTSFESIGFVDFIINIAPCIFFLCMPAALVMVVLIYQHYFTVTKMRVLDVPKLKRTYPIYDEPRLMIAGTVAFFVILLFFMHPLHHKDTAWIALLGAFITMAFTNPHDVQYALRNHIEWDTLLFFAGLFVLVEVCAAMGLLSYIGSVLASYISSQPEEKQLGVAITLILWVSAITSAFLDNIPYTATMIPVIAILAEELPKTLPLEVLAWALSFGACLGGNGTLLGASANIVTAGISSNKGFDISFLNFFYPGMLITIVTVAISNLYMMVVYVWVHN